MTGQKKSVPSVLFSVIFRPTLITKHGVCPSFRDQAASLAATNRRPRSTDDQRHRQAAEVEVHRQHVETPAHNECMLMLSHAMD